MLHYISPEENYIVYILQQLRLSMHYLFVKINVYKV